MTSGDRTRLLLIRHGESEVTVKQIIGGDRACTGLSPLGRRQSQALGERWMAGHEPIVDALWSSTLPRAEETAEALSAPLGGLKVHTHPNLVERRPGEALSRANREKPEPGDESARHARFSADPQAPHRPWTSMT